MDAKGAGLSTPGKRAQTPRKKEPEGSTFVENVNPNVAKWSPAAKSSGKAGMKNVTKSSNLLASPRNLMRERRFVVAKRKGGVRVCGKCREQQKGAQCLCAAYESLRASQETFFAKQFDGVGDQSERSDGGDDKDGNFENGSERIDDQSGGSIRGENLKNGADGVGQIVRFGAGGVKDGNFENRVDGDCDQGDTFKADCIRGENLKNGADGVDEEIELSSASFKRSRDKLLAEAKDSVPDPGSGRVMHLVQAFENLLSMRKRISGGETKESEGEKAEFCPSDLFLTSVKLGLDSRSSLDSSSGFGSASSGGGRRSRRSSTESCGSFRGSKWKKKQLRVTSQKPFKLRTEQRGRMKEEELMNKIHKMMEEQERMRIPIAQGLPWTTDEPECLVKPPVKESTRPIDLKLHSDARAAERAEFDHQVAEKMSLFELYRMERDRQQKLAEEEEIRRLRRELVPKAQPMPYFDRPFVPRRSEKNPTEPKEPNFHVPQHKKIRCMSLTDFDPCTFHQ